MFNRNQVDETHALDDTIAKLTNELAGMTAGSEYYTAAANSLKVLMEARTADKEGTKKDSLSIDTVAAIAANLLGIGMMLHHEKVNVITTKALGFIPKILK